MMRERRGAKKGQPAGKTDIAQHTPDVERVNTDALDAANFEGQPTPLSNRSVAVLCSLLAAILYTNTLGHDYTFDDLAAVQNNKDVNWSTPVLTTLGHDFWGADITQISSHKSYRPLTVQSFRVNFVLAGQTPGALHLGNVVLYAVCAYAVCRTVLAIGDTASTASVGSLVSAVWWTSHPVHTEAVASIVGRAEILCALFSFAAVTAVQWARLRDNSGALISAGPPAAWGAYTAAIAALMCATLAKETGITIAVVCAAPDVCCVVRLIWARRWSPKEAKTMMPTAARSMVRVIALAALCVGYLAGRKILMGVDTPSGRFEDNPLRFITREQRVLTALVLATENARLLTWPWVLSCDYSFDAIPYVKSAKDPRLYQAVLPLFVTLGGACIYAVRRAAVVRDAAVVVALSWLVFPLLPSSHIVDLGLVLAERTLFLPSIGVALLLKLVIDRLLAPTGGRKLTTRGIAVLVTATALCGSFQYRTVVRNRDWANNSALFRSANEAYPNSVKMLYMRGNIETNGEHAQMYYKRALEIYPFHCYSLSSMAAYMSHSYYRDLDKAVAYAERAGSSSACYFARGKRYYNQVMEELVPLIEADATAKTTPLPLRCKRLGQLQTLHSVDEWSGAEVQTVQQLKQRRIELGCSS